jgi:hypothetical protein
MYVEAVKFANHKPGLKGGAEGAIVRAHNEYQTIVGFSFFNSFFLFFFLARINNKYKLVYSFMVFCSENNVLEVINTDDIIKGFASQKERKNYLYK